MKSKYFVQVTDLFDTNTHMLYNSHTLWVVQFYSHWCGHCQRFAPFYRELAASISGHLFSYFVLPFIPFIQPGPQLWGLVPWTVLTSLVMCTRCKVPPPSGYSTQAPGWTCWTLHSMVTTFLLGVTRSISRILFFIILLWWEAREYTFQSGSIISGQ